MTRRTRATAPAAFLLAGAVAGSMLNAGPSFAADAPPPPGLGIRLVEAPTSRADDPRAKTYIVDHVAPGAQFTRRFEVTNGNDTAMDVRLYPATADVAEGSFSVRDADVAAEIVTWTSISPTTLRLAPRSRARAQVTVKVDPKATAGEYYGGVVAERPAAAGAGVGVNLRVAIRMYLSVGPGGEPASDFTVDSLTPGRTADGKPFVRAQVHNTGGRALDMSGTLRLSEGPGGLSAGPFPAKLGTTLAPGQTEPVMVELDKALPDGPWRARLDMASGLIKRSVEGTITFPKEGEAAPVKATAVADDNDSPPWAAIIAAGIGLLLLALLLWFLLGKKRAKRREKDEPA